MKINLGSGQRRFDSWVNVDIISRQGQVPDVIADGSGLPMKDGSTDCVVLQHVLEHFNLGKADGMLRECHRVLKRGGSLIVTVPDLRRLAQRWLIGQIEDYIFFVNTYGAYQGEEGDIHRWGFNQSSLLQSLEGVADWSKVKHFNRRVIPGADIASDWWIAGAECVK